MSERFLVFAGMRNEGPYIVEWVTWYRMLGFEVLVGTNDCTDHSVELLEALQDHGVLTHFQHRPPQDVPPKRFAYRKAKAHPLTAEVDWILVCDVDEFLVLHSGDGTIQGHMSGMGRDFLGIAFQWRCFGNGGLKTWRDSLVHKTFKRTGYSKHRANAPFKSMFRDPEKFAIFDDHSPLRPQVPWGQGENRWVTAAGEEMTKFLQPRNIRHMERDLISHDVAQMNHYIIRYDESFNLKRGTPSASARADRYTDGFYETHNRNGIFDDSALGYDARFTAIYEQMLALPDVSRLHHLCCADYVVRLCAHKGVDHRQDARWLSHMERAG